MIPHFQVQNPLQVHNVANFLPQLIGNKNQVLQRFEQRFGEPITATIAESRTHRCVTEALEKVSCPFHHVNPILQFLRQNDGQNGSYDVSNGGFCNEILCDGRYSSDALTNQFSSDYSLTAAFALSDVTTFEPNCSRAMHRLKVSYETKAQTNEIEIDIQKMSKHSLINFLNPDNTDCFGSVVIGKSVNQRSANGTTTQGSKSSVWLPIGTDVLIEIKMVSFESNRVWRNLNLAIAGAVGITTSAVSLTEQYLEMLYRPNHRSGTEKNIEKNICNRLRSSMNSNGNCTVTRQTNVKTHPCVVIYSDERNWHRSMQSSQFVIYIKKNANGMVRVNDTPLTNGNYTIQSGEGTNATLIQTETPLFQTNTASVSQSITSVTTDGNASSQWISPNVGNLGIIDPNDSIESTTRQPPVSIHHDQSNVSTMVSNNDNKDEEKECEMNMIIEPPHKRRRLQ